MLYLFTWNSDYLIDKEVKDWKTKFIKKWGDFNFIQIKSSDKIDNNILESNILWSSFLVEPKLIILELDNNESKDTIIEFLSENIDRIPDKNIVVLKSNNFDKRTKIFKTIKSKWEIKDYSISLKNNIDIITTIKSIYWWNKISNSAINLIISYKHFNLYKIISEIDKLLINNTYIDDKLIKNHILPEFEESIFILIDNILNCNKIKAIENLNTILEQSNIYQLYNALLSNLRTSLYIMLLKSKKINNSQIDNYLDLQKKAFLINKHYKIKYSNLKKMYINLVNIDKKNKSWQILWWWADLWSTDESFKAEIELLIMTI